MTYFRFAHHILAMVSVLVMCSCTSPLDTDAPRKITPITPALKITPQKVNVDFKTASGAYTFKGLPSINIDTTVSPMRFWLDLPLVSVPDTGTGPMLHEFRIRLDSFPGNGLIFDLVKGEAQLVADFGTGEQTYPSETKTNTVSILVAEHQRVPGQPREVTITVYIILNKDGFFKGAPQEQALGTIHLVI